MPYRNSLFSEDIYRELSAKLSEKEEEKLRREIHRLEMRQKDVSMRIWDDVANEKVRFTIVTSSGKKFVVEGRNWPVQHQAEFATPAEMNSEGDDDEVTTELA